MRARTRIRRRRRLGGRKRRLRQRRVGSRTPFFPEQEKTRPRRRMRRTTTMHRTSYRSKEPRREGRPKSSSSDSMSSKRTNWRCEERGGRRKRRRAAIKVCAHVGTVPYEYVANVNRDDDLGTGNAVHGRPGESGAGRGYVSAATKAVGGGRRTAHQRMPEQKTKMETCRLPGRASATR